MRSDPMPRELSRALHGGAETLFDLMVRRVHALVEDTLLTVLVPNEQGTRLVRVYSSNETAYPLGEADIVEDTRWFRQLFVHKQRVVANNGEEITAWLPGFADASPARYESLANLPVVADGEVIGIVNLMSARDRFTEERLRALDAEIPTAALAIMIAGKRSVVQPKAD